MKLLAQLITLGLLLTLTNALTECETPRSPAIKGVQWQMEQPLSSQYYYITTDVTARVDSVQVSFICRADTTRSHIMKSSNQIFSYTYRSKCDTMTKLVVNPFFGENYEQYIDIETILALPDTL